MTMTPVKVTELPAFAFVAVSAQADTTSAREPEVPERYAQQLRLRQIRVDSHFSIEVIELDEIEFGYQQLGAHTDYAADQKGHRRPRPEWADE